MNIELKNVKPAYMSEDEISFSDIYLQDTVTFEKGKKYLIKAGSGRGKTSLLNFIYGSNPNFDGAILYSHSPLKNSALFDLRKTKISYVFQDLKLFSGLSVIENIQLKNRITRYKTTEEIEGLLDRVKLGFKRESPAKTLSLGQKQRVAIIRALCQPFEFLLLDEPFSHLDDENSGIIATIIQEELAGQQAGLILTSLGNESERFDYDLILNL